MSSDAIVKELENLEYGINTSINESFNNSAAAWANKRMFFGHKSMTLRHDIASLHWNANCGKKLLRVSTNKVSKLRNKHPARTTRNRYEPMKLDWAKAVMRSVALRERLGKERTPIIF